ncbi:hypothetical protein P3T73_06755 [Kiritimatiellota bacterium B12222]|nr:hypothetical protein P3T73_06755 [Kiritimatiellota bacterium B12222]
MTHSSPVSCIWIHAPFRSGGTHIWNQFRSNEGFQCFYEPFNEWLSTYRRGKFDEEFVQMKPLMRHHMGELEYFHEFPVDDEGRIIGFEEAFALDRVCCESDQTDERLQEYVQSLIASAKGKAVVFKSCRSTLRAGWLHDTFPLRGISIVRNPRDQFRSFASFPEKYFDANLLMQTAHCGTDPRLQHLQTLFPLQALEPGSLRAWICIYQSLAQCLPDNVRYAFFYTWWWIHLLETVPVSDFLFDMNSVAFKPDLQRLLDQAGMPIDLKKCKAPLRADMKLDEAQLDIETWVEAQLWHAHPVSCQNFVNEVQRHEPFISDAVLKRVKRMRATTPGHASVTAPAVISPSLSDWGPEVMKEVIKLQTHTQNLKNSLKTKDEYIAHLQQELALEKERFLECERYAKSLESSS